MRLAVVVLLALVLAPAAAAGPEVDKAAAALQNDPVYVNGNARFTPQIADALRREIRTRGRGPIYIAVLPSAARAGPAGAILMNARTLPCSSTISNPRARSTALASSRLSARPPLVRSDIGPSHSG